MKGYDQVPLGSVSFRVAADSPSDHHDWQEQNSVSINELHLLLNHDNVAVVKHTQWCQLALDKVCVCVVGDGANDMKQKGRKKNQWRFDI